MLSHGRHGMNQLDLAIDPDMRLYAEALLIALLGLMHLGIPRSLTIFRRTGSRSSCDIDDRSSVHLGPCFLMYSPIRVNYCPPVDELPRDAETCRASSRRALARCPDQFPRTVAWRVSHTALLRWPDLRG